MKQKENEPVEIETAARFSVERAARMLGVTSGAVNYLVSKGKLPRYGRRRKYWFRIEDVEAIVRDPNRVRRHANYERKTRERIMPPAETPSDRALIGSREALLILGVCEKTLLSLVYTGQLFSYQMIPKKTPHRFDRAEVEALRDQRAAAKKAPRPPQRESRRPRYMTRPRLNYARRIEVGDLPEREKYFPEWINAR